MYTTYVVKIYSEKEMFFLFFFSGIFSNIVILRRGGGGGGGVGWEVDRVTVHFFKSLCYGN